MMIAREKLVDALGYGYNSDVEILILNAASRINRLSEEKRKLRRALSLAKSMILSGERMSTVAMETFQDALNEEE